MNMERQKIGEQVSGKEMFEIMAEGVIGAATAITNILSLPGEEGPKILAHLADMNIRGSQLAYVFQEVCDSNLLVLAMSVNVRNPKMVDAVNNFFKGSTKYKAVTEGALTADQLPTFETLS